MSIHMDWRMVTVPLGVHPEAIDEIDYADHIDVHALIANNRREASQNQADKIFAHYEKSQEQQCVDF